MDLYQREDLLFLEADQQPVGVPEEETLAAEAECSVSWAFTRRTRGGCSDRCDDRCGDRCSELLASAHLTKKLNLKSVCKYNKVSMFVVSRRMRTG
ncbi:hypothetical protein PSPO01_04049 [Paraphaeosphaeria sporulosa]